MSVVTKDASGTCRAWEEHHRETENGCQARQTEGQRGLARPHPDILDDSSLGWEGWRDFSSSHPHHAGYHLSQLQFHSASAFPDSLSQLRKWVARNRRQQHFRLSSTYSLFESQITSKCSSPAERQRLLPAATAHSRCDELVGPQGSCCQQSKPRGCHCLGEIGHCREARLSHFSIQASTLLHRQLQVDVAWRLAWEKLWETKCWTRQWIQACHFWRRQKWHED